MNILSEISKELDLRIDQVKSVINLFEDGATIPFIARYRKEKTGGLDEDQLRVIEERYQYLALLEDRKKTVLKSIEEQGKLTDELKDKIEKALKLQEVEDLYLPYKPKRKTRGSVAKAKGLEPLALFIINNPNFDGDIFSLAEKYIDAEKDVNSAEEAIQGAKDIIAEMISESAEIRELVREFSLHNSVVQSSKVENPDKELSKNKPALSAGRKDVYEIYHDFSVDINHIKEYQILAINRGEREGYLRINLSIEKDIILNRIYKKFFDLKESVFEELLQETTIDSFNRLILPSIEREVRKILSEKADLHAVEIFASNLKQLLLQPPISNKIIMGIDPGFVSGSKIAVIDTTGKYLEGSTIYPHPPQSKVKESKKVILDFIKKYNVDLIAVGNGTASRETEFIVADLIKENSLKCSYIIVNEAGASVYSASAVAKSEFPELEASQRGNISIARRVLDPLAELVKIDPKSIGVGLYQHDVNQKLLTKKLEDVVESCVNYIGVDINTASASLLTYVSGLNSRIAKNIIKYRENKGRFQNRNQLLKVTGVGEKLFEQAAGFLKIPGSDNPFDNTFIHPESYDATLKLLNECNISETAINEKGKLVKVIAEQKGLQTISNKIGVGIPTLEDILENLARPGRDPREDMPKPILRNDILKPEDLSIGMKLKGTVRNVVDFGAFVDIGLKQDALLHISQIANRYIKHPIEVLNVGDIIDVSIFKVDIEKGRVSLSMKS